MLLAPSVSWGWIAVANHASDIDYTLHVRHRWNTARSQDEGERLRMILVRLRAGDRSYAYQRADKNLSFLRLIRFATLPL